MDPSTFFDDECDVSGDDSPDEEEKGDDGEDMADFIDDSGGPAPSESDLAAARRLLGVQAGASAGDVAQGFRKRSLDVHPDKNPAEADGQRFTDLVQARDLLADSAERAKKKQRRVASPKLPERYVPLSDRGITVWYADVTLESLRARQRVRVRGTTQRDAGGIFAEDSYNVVIPAGAYDGDELCRLMNKGEYSAEDEGREPLVIRLRVMPGDVGVVRSGCNLETPLVLSLKDAMSPDKILSIDKLGHKAVVTVPRNGYWTGDTITIKNGGLPEIGGDDLLGDLVLKVVVEKPTRGEVKEFAQHVLAV